MRFGDRAEGEAFFRRHGIGPKGPIPGGRAESRFKTFKFWYRSRLTTAPQVGRRLARALGESPAIIVWSTELVWGDRSREEGPPPGWGEYRRWREAKGEMRSLYDAPTHVFEPGERDELARLIELAIVMGWDSLAAPKSGTPLVALSHNDLVTIYARSKSSPLLEDLERLGLNRSR